MYSIAMAEKLQIDGFHDLGPLAVQFKWFMPLFARLPRWLVLRINPGFGTFIKFKMVISAA